MSGAPAAFCHSDSVGGPRSHIDDILPRLVNLRALKARDVIVTRFFGRFLPPRLELLDVAGCAQNESDALAPVDAEVVALTAAPTLLVLGMGHTNTVMECGLPSKRLSMVTSARYSGRVISPSSVKEYRLVLIDVRANGFGIGLCFCLHLFLAVCRMLL